MSSFFEKEIHTGIVKLILFSKMLFKSKNSNKETKESFHVSFIVYILNAITSIIERFKNKKTNFLLTFLFYFAMRCAIWYHLYNFKKSEKHSSMGVVHLFFKLCKWYQIAQRITVLLQYHEKLLKTKGFWCFQVESKRS